jgi:hypothetical protein
MIGMNQGEWLVPFKGRNPCGTYNQNFLWRHKSLYVMDNHRAAMWCWLQHINPRSAHSLLHMDWHADALQSWLEEWLKYCPESVEKLSINEYLALTYPHAGLGHTPLFRWDNYLSIYLARYGQALSRFQVLTHGDGDKPNHPHIIGDLWDAPANMEYWLQKKNSPWIVNIDLDYFFWHDEERPGLMVSDTYIERCITPIHERVKDGSISVITIALTPDEGITGGWEAAESVAKHVLRLLDVEFRLPP